MSAGTKPIDAIIIGQSEIVRYEDYSKFPLDRIHLFQDLVFLRMVHFEGAFRSHLDLLNFAKHGKFYSDASYEERRKLLNIWNLPGLSSLLVANAGLNSGFNVKVVNCFDSEFDLFKEYYDAQSPRPLVGISTTFFLSYAEVKRIVTQLRKHDPEMKIVLGGAFVNEQTINKPLSDFEASMKANKVDYVLHAFNSDLDFPQLLRAVRGDIEMSAVPNLAYFDKEGKFQLSPKVWNNPTLNSIPMMWEQIDLPFANRTVQLRAASGCPFACAFCTYPETAGGHFAMELELIERQLEDIKKLGYVKQIIFIDDTFNVPIRRFKEILRILCKFDFEWFSFLRVQYVDEEVAQLMKQSGCKGVYLGIESANNGVLKNMNKKVTREAFVKGLGYLNAYDITTFAAFVIGFPGETAETIEENIRFLEECKIDFYSTKEFYYMQHASVHTDRAKYGLEGMGNKWKHDTMDSHTAAKMKVHMFKKVATSTFIDPDTSLWYIAYLCDQGYSMDDIKDIHKVINRMMMKEIDGNYGSKESDMDELRALTKRVDESRTSAFEPRKISRGA